MAVAAEKHGGRLVGAAVLDRPVGFLYFFIILKMFAESYEHS